MSDLAPEVAPARAAAPAPELAPAAALAEDVWDHVCLGNMGGRVFPGAFDGVL